jgi:hypothetical protein
VKRTAARRLESPYVVSYKEKIMALKFKAKSKEEIPSELQSLYVERDGAFVLDVEGAVDKARVDEFRKSKVAPMRKRDELKHLQHPDESGC